MLHQLLSPRLLQKLNQKITASLTPITSPNSLRRSSPLALVSRKLASQTKAASKIRNGLMPNQFPKRKKKISLLDPEAKPNVSVSANKSSFLKSINASSKLPLTEADVVDLVAGAVVVETVLVEAGAVKVADVVVARVVDVEVLLVGISEADPATMAHDLLLVARSTPTTPMLSQALVENRLFNEDSCNLPFACTTNPFTNIQNVNRNVYF